MKIRMLVSIAGTGFALSANTETDRFTAAEAVRLIEAGYAVPVSDVEIERAVKADARETRKGKRV